MLGTTYMEMLGMDTNRPAAGDPLDSSMYRLAHLHGNEWVTLKPGDEHSPKIHDPAGAWARGRMYQCESCDEKVMIAPNS